MVLNPTDTARAIALIQDGRSQYYVARALGVTRCSVQRAVKRFRETGEYTRKPGSGRKRCTTQQDDRYLRLRILRNRTSTAVEVRNDLHQAQGITISSRTVRRRFAEFGLSSRKPANGPELTRQHRIDRLNFAMVHRNWGIAEWSRILFTDESRFCLRSPDRRQRVWRRTGERYSQCNIVPTLNYGGGSIMVWGGISMEARTELVPVNTGTMTAARYITDILEPHVIPFAPFIGDDFILMDDNARPHVAHIVRDYLDEVGMERMVWPARSPDLNPIEHIWDMLGRQIRSRIPAPVDLTELSEVLVQEWNTLDQQVIGNLIEGMPRRMEAVIRARGGNTRY